MSSAYSQIFACLYDQSAPVGELGRGTHHSVFRSIEWREIDGDFRDSGREHNFAVIWDEDHDDRIIQLIESLHMTGLLWPIVFIGERKGVVTILTWQDIDPTKERGDWWQVTTEIVAHAIRNDPWTVEYGTFWRDPANKGKMTDPRKIIDDDIDLVHAYLQSIDVLWQLGERRRQSRLMIKLPDGAHLGYMR